MTINKLTAIYNIIINDMIEIVNNKCTQIQKHILNLQLQSKISNIIIETSNESFCIRLGFYNDMLEYEYEDFNRCLILPNTDTKSIKEAFNLLMLEKLAKSYKATLYDYNNNIIDTINLF